MVRLNFYPFNAKGFSQRDLTRFEADARVIEKILASLETEGWHPVHVDDGGDNPVSCTTAREVLKAAFAGGGGTLTLRHTTASGKHKRGHVCFDLLENRTEPIAYNWSEGLTRAITRGMRAPVQSKERPQGARR